MHLSLNTSCKIRPIVNQVECHAYLSQEKLLKFCQKHGIQLVAYSPLGSPGRLWASPNETHLLNDPVLEGIKLKHNKTAAQILIRWQVGISCLSEKYKSYCIRFSLFPAASKIVFLHSLYLGTKRNSCYTRHQKQSSMRWEHKHFRFFLGSWRFKDNSWNESKQASIYSFRQWQGMVQRPSALSI